ncbi:MAG TPA: cytochrome c3 family protein [Leptolinea sp.]
MPSRSAVVVGKKNSRKFKGKPKRSKRWMFIVLAVTGLFLVSGGAGFAIAATQEEDNSFCASCHSQPESTNYQRFQAATAVDLASDHHVKKDTKCIDCHSGTGTGGRLNAMMMGARNAVLWFSGTAKQPAPLNFPIPDENCLKCHQAVTTPAQADASNHFHVFLTRWQKADPNAATCVSCHSGHATDGNASLAMVNEVRTQQVCDACHKVLRGN